VFSLRNETGAVAVEFSIVLILASLFFIAFFEIIMLYIVHERMSYASYIGARANIVGGNSHRAVRMVNGGEVAVGGGTCQVWEDNHYQFDFYDISDREGTDIRIQSITNLPFVEHDQGGDN
jgi:hypothetical protein